MRDPRIVVLELDAEGLASRCLELVRRELDALGRELDGVAGRTEPPVPLEAGAEAEALGVPTGVDAAGEDGADVAAALPLEHAASASASTDATVSTHRGGCDCPSSGLRYGGAGLPMSSSWVSNYDSLDGQASMGR